MTRRRVLFVNYAAVLGGAELSLLDLATAYRKTSQVVLFTHGPLQERLEEAGVCVKVISTPQVLQEVRTSAGFGALKVFPVLWWLARQVAEAGQGFELVHANSQKAFIAAALATLMGGPPVVWHLRDMLTAGHFSSINRRLAVALANTRAERVLVNSRATGEAFVAAGGSQKLVTLVYNGVSTDAFDNLVPKQSAAIRTELGVGNSPLVGVFSRLSYWKGQHVLLEAMRGLVGIHVLLVGDALFGEAEYVSRLRTLAAAPELDGRVHWLGFRNDVPVLMAACNVLVHTSTEPEPFGRAIVEGQLSKRPVVATAAGGALELIQDGLTGRLVVPGDPVALGQAIHELLSDPTGAAAIAEQAYVHARATFSLEALLVAFDQALEVVHR